ISLEGGKDFAPRTAPSCVAERAAYEVAHAPLVGDVVLPDEWHAVAVGVNLEDFAVDRVGPRLLARPRHDALLEVGDEARRRVAGERHGQRRPDEGITEFIRRRG